MNWLSSQILSPSPSKPTCRKEERNLSKFICNTRFQTKHFTWFHSTLFWVNTNAGEALYLWKAGQGQTPGNKPHDRHCDHLRTKNITKIKLQIIDFVLDYIWLPDYRFTGRTKQVLRYFNGSCNIRLTRYKNIFRLVEEKNVSALSFREAVKNYLADFVR